MSKGTNIDDVVNKVTKELIKKYEVKYREAGKAAMKEIRTSIVKEWFSEFSWISMVGATKYTSRVINHSAGAAIEILSYIDVDVYDPKLSAERWVNKYGGMTDPKEYVLNLQLYQGIIGLPEKSNAYPEHGWVNENFHEKEPLWNVLINDSRWKDYESYFYKYIK